MFISGSYPVIVVGTRLYPNDDKHELGYGTELYNHLGTIVHPVRMIKPIRMGTIFACSDHADHRRESGHSCLLQCAVQKERHLFSPSVTVQRKTSDNGLGFERRCVRRHTKTEFDALARFSLPIAACVNAGK